MKGFGKALGAAAIALALLVVGGIGLFGRDEEVDRGRGRARSAVLARINLNLNRGAIGLFVIAALRMRLETQLFDEGVRGEFG